MYVLMQCLFKYNGPIIYKLANNTSNDANSNNVLF